MTTPPPAVLPPLNHADLLEALVPVARAAGAAILQVYGTDFAVRTKRDASSVTDADERAEAIILAALATLTPDVPVIAEEAVAAGTIPVTGARFWLVDALDGTREFIERNDEFTVNIALIEHGVPVLGVVHAPALGCLYAGRAGAGAFVETCDGRRAIACRHAPDAGVTVVASRAHGDTAALAAWLRDRKVAATRQAGSSLKLCLIAAGQADLYPRFGRTMEWDIAAGHAVLSAAGGRVTTLAGIDLRYGKAGMENPHFVATGKDS